MENQNTVSLYRAGTQMRWEGQDLDMINVQDDDEAIAAAKKEGWMTVREILKEPARKAAAAEKEAADKAAAAEKTKGGKKDSKPEDLA